MTTHKKIEAAQASNVGQLLMRAGRLVDEIGVERVRNAMGLPWLRRAHTALLPHIRHDGVRPTEIAERLGVSKQAVGPLLDELEREGLIEREADPGDARAKRVRYSEHGRHAMMKALSVLAGIEGEMFEGVAAEDRATFLRVLQHVVRRLETVASTLNEQAGDVSEIGSARPRTLTP
jgi:DNA-binding MarR family transcriptional regulator